MLNHRGTLRNRRTQLDLTGCSYGANPSCTCQIAIFYHMSVSVCFISNVWLSHKFRLDFLPRQVNLNLNVWPNRGVSAWQCTAFHRHCQERGHHLPMMTNPFLKCCDTLKVMEAILADLHQIAFLCISSWWTAPCLPSLYAAGVCESVWWKHWSIQKGVLPWH